MADPDAGRVAGAYCVESIAEAIRSGAVEAVLAGSGGELVVKSIEYHDDLVDVEKATRDGANVEHAQYELAAFVVRVVGDLTPDERVKLFAGAAVPALGCTEAHQYFAQESARDIASDLQDLVWGPRSPGAGPAAGAAGADGDDAPAAGFAGDWTLSRSITSCTNFPEGCQSTPIRVRISGCRGAVCTIQRTDGVWKQAHTVTRAGANAWSAEFDDVTIQCKGRRNVGTVGMAFTVSGATLTGSYTVSAQENPPDCDSNANAVYDLRGARS